MRTEPVVLVHGFASSFEREWREPGWTDLLSDAGREVIGVDLLGHGKSAKPHDPEAYGDLESGVVAALPENQVVDAIGFSLGARTLLNVASRQPERFGRLVVGGVGGSLLQRADTSALADAIEGKVAPDNPIAQVFTRFAHNPENDPLALAACMRRAIKPMTAEQLAQVTLPVLLVLSDQDETAGPLEPVLEALPDARAVTIKGVDHLGTAKDFRFIDAALQFIEAVPA